MFGRKFLAVLALTAIIVAGCGMSEKPKPKTAQFQFRDPNTKLSMDEKEALVVTQSYFDFLSQKDYASAVKLRTSQSRASLSDESVIAGMKAIRYIKVLSLTVDTTHPIVPNAILVHVVLEVDAPGTAWDVGRNTRFALLLKEDGVWRIHALGTG